MKYEEFRQTYVDRLLVDLADAAATATSVYNVSLSIERGEMPTLPEVLEHAEWAWKTVVAPPIRQVRDDFDVEPTEMDEVRQHFMMMARRRHIEALRQVEHALDHVEPDEDTAVDLEDVATGLYL